MLCGQCFSEIAGADVCPVCGRPAVKSILWGVAY